MPELNTCCRCSAVFYVALTGGILAASVQPMPIGAINKEKMEQKRCLYASYVKITHKSTFGTIHGAVVEAPSPFLYFDFFFFFH